MTRDELYLELPRLTAFAKIVFLDRPIGYAAVRQWLTTAAAGPSLRWVSRVDAYRSVATWPLHSGSRTAPAPGQLADPLLRELGARDRAWWILTGPLGFSDDVADEIVDHMPARVDMATPEPQAIESQDLRPGPWPDLRGLRLAG